MATSSITIRMEENLKHQAEELFADMGMNMTTAFNVFARAAVRQGKIPFEITGSRVPNAETIAAIEEIEAGVGLIGPFTNMDDLRAALMADGDV